MKNMLLFIIALVALSCTRVKNEELAKYWWKNGDANGESTVLIFTNEKPKNSTNECWIKGDIIYCNDKPELLVTGTYRKDDGSINLSVLSFETGVKSTYHSKKRHSENR